MPEGSSPWPLRWIVDEHGRDTGFAMLRRPLQSVEEAAFEKTASDHRLIGFTHYGPFPLYHESYDRRHKGRPPEDGWERPEVQACEAWAHCFQDPDRLAPRQPRLKGQLSANVSSKLLIFDGAVPTAPPLYGSP